MYICWLYHYKPPRWCEAVEPIDIFIVQQMEEINYIFSPYWMKAKKKLIRKKIVYEF